MPEDGYESVMGHDCPCVRTLTQFVQYTEMVHGCDRSVPARLWGKAKPEERGICSATNVIGGRQEGGSMGVGSLYVAPHDALNCVDIQPAPRLIPIIGRGKHLSAIKQNGGACPPLTIPNLLSLIDHRTLLSAIKQSSRTHPSPGPWHDNGWQQQNCPWSLSTCCISSRSSGA